MTAKFDEILELDNVTEVYVYDVVLCALAALGVTPDASYEADLLSLHQTDEKGEYYFLYNYKTNGQYPAIDRNKAMKTVDTEVILAGEGKPYFMNAWSGQLESVSAYEVMDGAVKIPLHFERDEVKLIVLLTDEQAAANGLDPEAEPVVKTACADPVSITDWTLKINSVHQGDTLFWRDSQWTELESVQLSELKPWDQINEEWAGISGIGEYSAIVELEKGWDEGYGAWLNVGQTGDTYSVIVNGTEVPYIDQTQEIVDIGPYVKAGENEIVIVVASTLYSAIYHTPNEYEGNGLLGTDGVVTMIPYEVH